MRSWQSQISHTLKSGPIPSEKADPGTLENPNPITNFPVWIKNLFVINSKVLISNMTIVSLNSSPKIPTQEIFNPIFRSFYFFTKLQI